MASSILYIATSIEIKCSCYLGWMNENVNFSKVLMLS